MMAIDGPADGERRRLRDGVCTCPEGMQPAPATGPATRAGRRATAAATHRERQPGERGRRPSGPAPQWSINQRHSVQPALPTDGRDATVLGSSTAAAHSARATLAGTLTMGVNDGGAGQACPQKIWSVGTLMQIASDFVMFQNFKHHIACTTTTVQ